MSRTRDDSQVAEAARLSGDGLTSAEIAGRMGVDPRTVQRWLDLDPAAKRPRGPDRPGDLDPAFPREDMGRLRTRLGDLPAWVLRGTAFTGRCCLVWCGQADKSGYGRRHGKLVHRLVWKMLVNPDLSPDVSLASRPGSGCEYLACIAPWHWEETTQDEILRRRASWSAAQKKDARQRR